MQDGVTLLTTLGNRSYFEKIRKSGVWPNAAVATTAKIEVFDREKEFKNGSQIFKLFAVTNPHVDELIVGYLPSERILYVADPFTNDWGRLRQVTPEERGMMKTLAELHFGTEDNSLGARTDYIIRKCEAIILMLKAVP